MKFTEFMNIITKYDPERLLGLPLGIFLIILGFHLNKKLKLKREEHGEIAETSDKWNMLNKRDIEDIKSGNSNRILIRYAGLFCIFIGVFGVFAFLSEVFGAKYDDTVFSHFLMMYVIVAVCITIGVVYRLMNDMGNDVKKLDSVVINTYKLKDYTIYRIVVSYNVNGEYRTYNEKYNYSKKKCPQLGEKHKLIYSYKYDKVLSENEIRQNRKYSFYGFAMAVFFAIVFLFNIVG